MRKNELSYKSLKNICNPNNFKFETTDDLDSKDLIYGQDRGIKALEFGLDVEAKGYNLYVEGPSGVGKTMYTKNYVNKIAAKKKTPDDWCYIYNFEEPNEPIAVSLPAGKGKEFRDDMNSFIQDIKRDIKLTFGNEDFDKQKSLMQSSFEQKKNALLEKLNKQSMKSGFQVKTAQNGVYMMPILNGKTIEEEEFEKLDIRVGKVLECEKVPKSSKLLRFTLQVGSETRQILSGIAKFHKPEELIGKNVLFVANLKPRKMMGLESCGMILSAEFEDKLTVLTTLNDIQSGAEIV